MTQGPDGRGDPTLAELRRRTGVKWQRYGEEVVPAWIADMDFPPAPPVRRAILAALERGDLGYPDFDGLSGVPAAFAEHMSARHGWEVDPAAVVVVGDVVQSIYLALETCTSPGDGVWVHTPVYPPFLQAVAECRRRLVATPLVPGADRYELDPDDLPRPVPRLLLLCNPHNPTGRVFERDELAALAEVALREDLVVVADEIHADLTFPGHTHLPFATLGPEVAARTITLSSATKAFNLAGLRCSVAHFGSEELRRAFTSVPSHLRGTVGSLALVATATAWREGQGWLDDLRGRLDANRQLLASLVAANLGGVRYRQPEATYLAWLDCRPLGLDGSPWRHFLERAGVALSDGASFGEPGQGHVRLNFATTEAVLTEVVERMGASLRP